MNPVQQALNTWHMEYLLPLAPNFLVFIGQVFMLFFIVLACVMKYNKKTCNNAWGNEDPGLVIVLAVLLTFLIMIFILIAPIAICLLTAGLVIFAGIKLIEYLVNKS